MISILHIGNIAGVPQILSRAQRKIGFKSDVLSFDFHPFEYEIDLYYPIKLPKSLTSLRFIGFYLICAEKILDLLRISNKYDVFHFHFSSIIPSGRDIIIWKLLGKKVIIHHHGSDIRNIGEQQLCSKYSDEIIVSTPDLLEWSPNAKCIMNPISLDDFTYLGVENKHKSEWINIVHAPSNRAKKGTEYVIKAIDSLKNEGYKINLILIEQMSHDKAIEYYKKADIVIDQLLIGWYGMFAIECMALGKPVCSFIRDDLKSFIPNNPIINTSPQNIVENLKILIEDGTLRKKVGSISRKYVEDMHDAEKISRQLTNFYRE